MEIQLDKIYNKDCLEGMMKMDSVAVLVDAAYLFNLGEGGCKNETFEHELSRIDTNL